MNISCSSCLEVNYICQMLVLYMRLGPMKKDSPRQRCFLSERPYVLGPALRIAKEELIWDAFSGQPLALKHPLTCGSRMFLCDFGANSGDCHPDDPVRGPDCVGPGAI